MAEVSIRELRNRAVEVVDRAARGEPITITRAGKRSPSFARCRVRRSEPRRCLPGGADFLLSTLPPCAQTSTRCSIRARR
jgi:antitoxin (DNA-binding transcriptional repressor) of toxin-antitoxin stability system